MTPRTMLLFEADRNTDESIAVFQVSWTTPHLGLGISQNALPEHSCLNAILPKVATS